MLYSNHNFLRYFQKHAYTILLAVFVLWVGIGVFPLNCYETDSMEIIMGCDILYHQGWSLPPALCYEYRMQPLMVNAIVAFKYIFSFLTSEQIYCIFTAIASFIFLIGSIEFVREITNHKRINILIAAMLLPEMYAIAMYPNSAIPAPACFIWALKFIIYRKHWPAILLMCIAPLFRVDVVIVYPVILPLFIYYGHSAKKSVLLSGGYGLIVTTASLFLFEIFKADVLSSFTGYNTWNGRITTLQVLVAIFGFYSLSYLILIPCGIYAIIRHKKWEELFMVLVPILLLHFIYRSMGCASKHYLYIAPFVMIIGVRAMSLLYSYFTRKNILIKSGVIVCIILFYTVSIRLFPTSKPWYVNHTLYNGGIVIPIYSTNTSSTNTKFGIGAGQLVPTLDEKMLASGHLFYSWYIHSLKTENQTNYLKQKSALDAIPSSEIITISWGARAPLISMFLSQLYNIKIDKPLIKLSNKGRELDIQFFNIEEIQDKERECALSDYLENRLNELQTDNLYILAAKPRDEYYLENLSKKGKIFKVAEMLYKYNHQ